MYVNVKKHLEYIITIPVITIIIIKNTYSK